MESPITSISERFAPAARVVPLVEVGHLAPPPALLDEIAQAAETYDVLQAGGHELAFTAGADGARVAVELRDVGGNVLETLSIADALAVAAGRPLG